MKILRALSILWVATGIAVLAFLVVEGLAQLLTSQNSSAPPTQDALATQADAVELFAEINAGTLRHRFEPFVHYRLQAHQGRYITVDDAGLRQHAQTTTASTARELWMFGGSTLWGIGAQDSATIPALVQAAFPAVRVRNFGQIGYMSTQELITLVRRLQTGARPAVVVFYDGVNEVLPVVKLGRVGLPLDVPRRELEFNITKSWALDRLTLAGLSGWARKSILIRRFVPKARTSGASAQTVTDDSINKVVDTYVTNISIVRAAAETYDFVPLFFWQPTVYAKPKLSPDEAKEVQKTPTLASAYRRTQEAISTQEQVIDLSGTFSEVPAAMFYDFCHLSEAGNGYIMQAMLPHLRAALARGNQEPESSSTRR